MLFEAILLAAAAAQEGTPLGWALPKWGLSPSELVDQSAGKIERLTPPPGDKSRVMGLQLGAKSDVGEFNLVYLFTPMSQRLAGIIVTPHDMKKCSDWTAELRASLGEPYYSEQRGMSVVANWLDAQTAAEFTLVGPGKHAVCRLVLQPSAGLGQ